MAFERKVCIVTGANSGIGEAIAILFAEKKANVVLCGRSEERLDACLQKCLKVSRNSKDKFLKVIGDLKIAAERNAIIDKTVAKFGKIDVLVCNAGTLGQPTHLLETTEESFDEIMGVNVKSVFFLIKQAVPYLVKTTGSIVAVSSVSSQDSTPHIAYGTSKAAVDHMVRCLAPQLGPEGIRINTVNPTVVQRTRIARTMAPELNKAGDKVLHVMDGYLDTKVPLHPIGRVATPEDVAHATVFLSSKEASFITGQNMVIDGGMSLTSRLFPKE